MPTGGRPGPCRAPNHPPDPPPPGERGTPLLRFDHLALERGHVDIKDQQLQVAAGVDFALGRPLEAVAGAASGAAAASGAVVALDAPVAAVSASGVAGGSAMPENSAGLTATAEGTYRG